MNVKSKLAAFIGMAALAEEMNKDLVYTDSTIKPYSKLPLSNKQKKARKKAKVGRKQNRKSKH